MTKDKREQMAILQKRRDKIAVAVKNSLMNLKKMGIDAEVITKEDDPDVAFIVIPLDDIIKVIERKCRKAVEQGAKGVEIVAYRESDLLMIRIRK